MHKLHRARRTTEEQRMVQKDERSREALPPIVSTRNVPATRARGPVGPGYTRATGGGAARVRGGLGGLVAFEVDDVLVDVVHRAGDHVADAPVLTPGEGGRVVELIVFDVG